jgi:hypothetical protein
LSFRSRLSVVDRTLDWKLCQSSLTTSQLTIGAFPPAALAGSPLPTRPVEESYSYGDGHSENETEQNRHGGPPGRPNACGNARTMERPDAVIVPRGAQCRQRS